MKFQRRALFVCAAALMTFGAQQARAADWVAETVSPKGNPKSERVFVVKIREIEGDKQCEIIISPNAKVKAAPIKADAKGKVFVNPEGYRMRGMRSPDKKVVAEGEEEVKAKETRKKNAVTYTFRVPAEKLPKLRLEFREGDASAGIVYWLEFRDYAPPQK